jgi:2-polyprenyl-6-methoxyphenol hydroxylase-like FAD-dependent oxidoreductase
MGFGVAKAGGDAQALAEALRAHEDIDAALEVYNRRRQPVGERIMLHGRKLGTYMGVDVKSAEDRKMEALLQDYRAMMDWIAVPNFLSQ